MNTERSVESNIRLGKMLLTVLVLALGWSVLRSIQAETGSEKLVFYALAAGTTAVSLLVYRSKVGYEQVLKGSQRGFERVELTKVALGDLLSQCFGLAAGVSIVSKVWRVDGEPRMVVLLLGAWLVAFGMWNVARLALQKIGYSHKEYVEIEEKVSTND